VATPSTDDAGDPPPRWSPDPRALLFALVVATFVAAAAAIAVGSGQRHYVASSATLLDQPIAIALSQDAGTVDKLSRLRFKYAGVVHSDEVLDRVATEVGVDRDTLASNLFTRGDPESLLLFISAESTSKTKAVQTANALAKELGAYIDREQLAAKIAPRDRISLKVVAPARGASRISPTRRQQLTSAVGAALATFVLAIGAAELYRRRS
jgi:capsular polysaccharide biosynthesis protein